jgi:hypothetical protein
MHRTVVLRQRKSASASSSTQLKSIWGNYVSDGKLETKIGLVLATLLTVKSVFTPISIKNAYTCPYGAGAEKRLAENLAFDPTYKCASTPQLLINIVTSPFVFPGDPEFDPNIFNVQMRGMKAPSPQP